MPPSTKESAIAGPALVAAAWPVSTKIPAPMMQPIPREIRLHAESVRFKGTPPWVTKAWTSVSSASALSTAIDFLAKIFDTCPFPSSPHLGFTTFLVRTCWAKLAAGTLLLCLDQRGSASITDGCEPQLLTQSGHAGDSAVSSAEPGTGRLST